MAAIIGICLMSIVSAIETIGDISEITKGGAGREATDKELSGGTFADGLGTALAFGLGLHSLPEALQHLPSTAQVLLASGLLPAAFLAVILNLVLPENV